MTRKEEFEKVKELIRENIELTNCGLFNTRNVAGDEMKTLFDGKYFTLDICESWSYYELFGTNENEWNEINYIYAEISDNPFYCVI